MNKLYVALALSLSLATITACNSDDGEKKTDDNIINDNNSGSLGGGATYGDGTVANPSLTEAPVYKNIGVHDPSVVRDENGTFYVFGSHLSAAKTDDLISWTRVADGVDDNNPLFDTYATQASEGISWTDGFIGSWAADVIQLANGKYYFYYNHCAQGPEGNCISRSYMGIATSENVEGPYTHQQLILKTGHRAEDGFDIEGDTYTGNTDPNAIDPDVFFDKEQSLWMVYGSYSGGIFIKELDSATGLPLDNTSYGTKLAGGGYSAIEGPFILYSPVTDYYYLFLSYAGYDQKGGYNLRVSRSRTPDGPYIDASGQDVINASGGLDAIDKYGNKVIGGFNFASGLGLSGTDYGYMAPGHGSAYYDADADKHILFFHTRFPNRGEQHEVRIHEMFVTEDDWLVVSPHRYSDVQGDNIVDEEDILGTYQFLNHQKDSNKTVKESSYVTLDNEGKVTGELKGSYTFADNNLVITTDSAITYKGVASWQWHEQEKLLTPTFTAQSGNGINIWGSKMPFVDYESALAALADGLDIPSATVSSITLPTEGILGAVVTWQSSEPSVLSTNGTVTLGSTDVTVTLTATIELDGHSTTKEFTVVVKAANESGLIAHYAFEDDLLDSNGVYEAAKTTSVVYSTLGGQQQFANGINGQAFNFNGTTGIALPNSLITSDSYAVSIWIKPDEITQFTAGFFAGLDGDSWFSLLPMSWNSQTMLWSNNNGSWFDGITDQTMAVGQWTHMVMVNDAGTVAVYMDGALVFSGEGFPDLFSTGQGDILLGINYFDWDPLFDGKMDELKIFNRPLVESEVTDLFNEFN